MAAPRNYPDEVRERLPRTRTKSGSGRPDAIVTLTVGHGTASSWSAAGLTRSWRWSAPPNPLFAVVCVLYRVWTALYA